MGRKIEGWVEYCSFTDKEHIQSNYGWTGLINIGTAIQFVDDVNLIVFGNPDGDETNQEYNPLAKERGLPSNPSPIVREELASHRLFESEYGYNNAFGFNHIYYEEIEAINFQDYTIEGIEESDWFVLFKMIDIFKKERKLNNTGLIRLLIWYSY